jgi:lysophospholipase L1-like esterase
MGPRPVNRAPGDVVRVPGAHPAGARSGGKVIGATLLPFRGSHHYSARSEAKREQINDWVRTSGEYDGVADFDRVLASPSDPESINPVYDSGDHLHPNDAGYRLMADTIDISHM